MIRQILISLAISILITVVVNAILFLITGSLGWQNVLFVGLFFGLFFPFSKRRKNSHPH
jgi:ABC-type bacteriocin/lantibiotic exporter with double-glycine peptidase domain